MGAIVAISMATSPAVLRRDEGNHSTADSPNGTTKDNYSASFDKVRKLDQLERETERAREQLGNAEEELTLVRGSGSFNDCEIKRLQEIEGTLLKELEEANSKLGVHQEQNPSVAPGQLAEDAAIQVAELQERYTELSEECSRIQKHVDTKKGETDALLPQIATAEAELQELLKGPRAADTVTEAVLEVSEIDSQIEISEKKVSAVKGRLAAMSIELNQTQRLTLRKKTMHESKATEAQRVTTEVQLEVQQLGNKLKELQAQIRQNNESDKADAATQHTEMVTKLSQLRDDNKSRAASNILELNQREARYRLVESELTTIKHAEIERASQVSKMKSVTNELSETQREMLLLEAEVVSGEEAVAEIDNVRKEIASKRAE